MTGDGQFEVLELLGEGGFGAVYRARFQGEGAFSKEVALKVLNADMEGVAEVAVRLRDEARVLGLLRHRAIVQVDRLARLDGRWTVVMEYVEGVDLSRVVRAGPTPPGVALEIAAEVAGALHAAFTSAGPSGAPLRLLHRDLKPQNIRLTPHGGVKVLDFGIARAEFASREAKTRSLAFGTPEYMAPERLDFQGDGPEGDVYALGSVLYELLTGDQLGRTSANPVRHAARLDAAREALQRVPREAAELVLATLAFEPGDRPSAEDFEAEALSRSRVAGGEPLRLWARRAVPALRASQGSEDAPTTVAPLTGRVLVDGGGDGTRFEPVSPGPARPRTPAAPLTPAATAATPPRVPTPPPVATGPAPGEPTGVRRGLLGAGLVLALLGGSGVVAALGWALWPRSARIEPEQVVLQPDAPVEVEGPAVEEPSDEAPGEAPVDAPALGEGPVPPAPLTSTPTRTGASSATTRASSAGEGPVTEERAVSSPPPPPTPKTGAVLVEGDALRVVLVSASRSYPVPGDVPAGTYDVRVTFPGDPEAASGSVTVGANATVTLNCVSFAGKCVSR